MPRQRVVGDFSVRITGIGGSGVVTLAQIIATAAVLDGRHVRTLDQTGLAQKGGAVVSDVRVTELAVESAARLADGECDLYLATDCSSWPSPPTSLQPTPPGPSSWHRPRRCPPVRWLPRCRPTSRRRRTVLGSRPIECARHLLRRPIPRLAPAGRRPVRQHSATRRRLPGGRHPAESGQHRTGDPAHGVRRGAQPQRLLHRPPGG
nr:2-oxoacid:acceptor oxidoreductase family protein [Salinispora arenicola]